MFFKYLIFPFLMFSELLSENALCEGSKKINEQNIFIGQKLYINGDRAQGEVYFSTPFIAGSTIYEVPNIVVSKKNTPYGRGFETSGMSKIQINDDQLTAEVKDFREFTLKNKDGKTYVKRKITGASSLYEIQFNGKVIAWGVGWYKYGRSLQEFCYGHLDFSVLRIFIPIMKNKQIIVQEVLLHGIVQSEYQNCLKNAKVPVIVASATLDGACNASSPKYSLPIYIALDSEDGVKEISEAKKLQDLGITPNDKYPLYYLYWLFLHGEVEELAKYIKNNYRSLSAEIDQFLSDRKIETTKESKIQSTQKYKDKCEAYLKKMTYEDGSEILNICLPLIMENEILVSLLRSTLYPLSIKHNECCCD